jgi:hypothetical protein
VLKVPKIKRAASSMLTTIWFSKQEFLLFAFSQNLPRASKASRMEAGGFEPPSRDVSRQVSTCLVVLLFFSPR